MRKISGILLSLMMLVSIGLSVAYAAETVTSTGEDYWLADTPTKYGFKGLYTLFSPDTAPMKSFCACTMSGASTTNSDWPATTMSPGLASSLITRPA